MENQFNYYHLDLYIDNRGGLERTEHFCGRETKVSQYKLWVSLKHLGLCKTDDNTNLMKERVWRRAVE